MHSTSATTGRDRPSQTLVISVFSTLELVGICLISQSGLGPIAGSQRACFFYAVGNTIRRVVPWGLEV